MKMSLVKMDFVLSREANRIIHEKTLFIILMLLLFVVVILFFAADKKNDTGNGGVKMNSVLYYIVFLVLNAFDTYIIYQFMKSFFKDILLTENI